MHTWPPITRRDLTALASALLLCLSGPSRAEGPRPPTASPPTAPAGLRLSPRPLLDEVFGDAPAQQRSIDRFIELTGQLRRVCDDFSRAVQESLAELNGAAQAAEPAVRQCPAQVARPYARAQNLGQEYLRIGRELNLHYEQVREQDRLGDHAGLTPDYSDKIHQVLRSYETLLSDYREMKTTFHEHLSDELRFAGCDPAQLLARAGVRTAEPAKAEEHGAAAATAGTLTAPVKRPDATGPSLGAVAGAKAEDKEKDEARRLAGEGSQGRILFYVDNSRCRKGHRVYVDGRQVGEVSGATRGAFHSTVGPHELCLIGEGELPGPRLAAVGAVPALDAMPLGAGPCDTSRVRRAYFHDGWTIALRCE